MTRTLLAATLTAALAYSQNAPKAFDVATVKPNAGNDFRMMIRMAPGGVFTATGVTLRMLIGQAYAVRDFQIQGGPSWIGTDRWDINAKLVGQEGQLPPGQMRPLLVNLLEDRYELKTHTETREMPIYVLTVAKGGVKMKQNDTPLPDFSKPLPPPSSPTPGGGPPQMGPGSIRMGRGLLQGVAVGLDGLMRELSQITGRSVVDKTDLKERFDFTLNWTPEPGEGGAGLAGGPPPPGLGGGAPPPDPGGPSLFTALQEQLGLRLEPAKGPVDVLVIDHVGRPSEN